MGRSRRRAAKSRPTVTVRVKKKPRCKSKLPAEIAAGRACVEAKLGSKPSWDVQGQLSGNYAVNNFLLDANTGFGRNRSSAASQVAQRDPEGEDGCESDDDLRQHEGKPRRDGRRAAVPPLTAQQRRTIKGLLDAHADDVEAMVKDTKRNRMLLPASKLRRLIEGYFKYGEKARCSFRTPVKSL